MSLDDDCRRRVLTLLRARSRLWIFRPIISGLVCLKLLALAGATPAVLTRKWLVLAWLRLGVTVRGPRRCNCAGSICT